MTQQESSPPLVSKDELVGLSQRGANPDPDTCRHCKKGKMFKEYGWDLNGGPGHGSEWVCFNCGERLTCR